MRQRRHSADLDEAEAEPERAVDRFGMFVEAGGEPDRIAETQTEGFDSERGRIGCRPQRRRGGERRDRQPVGLLGVELVDQRPRQAEQRSDHATSSGKTWPLSPDGSGATQRACFGSSVA